MSMGGLNQCYVSLCNEAAFWRPSKVHDNSEQKGPTLDVGLGREHPLLLSRGWGGLKEGGL